MIMYCIVPSKEVLYNDVSYCNVFSILTYCVVSIVAYGTIYKVLYFSVVYSFFNNIVNGMVYCDAWYSRPYCVCMYVWY